MQIARRIQIVAGAVGLLVALGFYANVQITKGATFHKLNYLHYKYSDEVAGLVAEVAANEPGRDAPIYDRLDARIREVRAQPRACLDLVNVADALVMRLIGTHRALDLCREDVADGDRALAALAAYRRGEADFPATLATLREVSGNFLARSEAFEPLVDRTVDFIIRAMTGASLAVGLALVVAIWRNGRGITRPLTQVTEVTTALADGELDREVPGRERGDELGALARSIEVFRQSARREARLREERLHEREAAAARGEQVMSAVRDFDSDIEAILTRIQRGLDSVNGAADTVDGVNTSTRDHAETVAASVEQTRGSVRTVSEAADQLAGTIAEISRQADGVAHKIRDAVTQAERTDERVQSLSRTADTIGEVVELINDIAEQTNLLALNATIEAARAGEAGKGFAVVAGEVKSLANQTTQATEQIAGQIRTMQAAVQETVAAIGGIRKTIADADGATNSIASAVEEQSASTQEIDRHTDEVAKETEGLQTRTEALSREVARSAGALRDLRGNHEVLRGELDALIARTQRFSEDIRRVESTQAEAA